MTPVSLTWGMADDEGCTEFAPLRPPECSEPIGPFALADLLSEIVARYPTRPRREQLASVSWLSVDGAALSIPVLQR
jgi:hypothetical protein